MDFVEYVLERPSKSKAIFKPIFIIDNVKDIMIRGHAFYAIWVESNKQWSTDINDAVRLIDSEMREAFNLIPETERKGVSVKWMRDSSSGSMEAFLKYCQKFSSDSFVQLDSNLVFADQEGYRELYSSKKLSYSIADTDISAYNEIISTLYNDEERFKIEWAIGCILSGDSKKTQKFLVFYGDRGTGKSTILNIVEMLFDGYCVPFDAEALGSKTASFALEQFNSNPLVAIQHDGDLSHIDTNIRLNSLVSHEKMTINEKFKSLYSTKFDTFLMMGTNNPVRITNSKSGLLRRLIDVTPTGILLNNDEYVKCMNKIPFELGGIAKHCLEVYRSDPKRYNDYVPYEMMTATNTFYDFMVENYETFKRQDNTTRKAAWAMYKDYTEYANITSSLNLRAFGNELRSYFREYKEDVIVDGVHVRRLYFGFKSDKFDIDKNKSNNEDNLDVNVEFEKTNDLKDDAKKVDVPDWLKLEFCPANDNVFNYIYKDQKAQPAGFNEKPKYKWDDVNTTLKDIDTTSVHYILMPCNFICIDFDLKDENGNKSLSKNIEAALHFPKTYAEVSKGGGGLHLYYIYKGDVSKLSAVYSENIEVKIFTGKSSLRRKLTKSNTEQIATISSGLPTKEVKPVLNREIITNEKALRTLVIRNLRKEYHGYTKPSMDYIKKILDDAYEAGANYDLRDFRPAVANFAAASTNNSKYCMDLIGKIHWTGREEELEEQNRNERENIIFSNLEDENREIVFYDVEVFPNLFVVCWKKQGDGGKETVVSMINPTPIEIENLCRNRLIGFNNREYDNHILYGRLLGYTIEQIYELSCRLVSGSPNCKFREAYSLSYTDVYDFTSKKQSLKKYEIEYHIHHQELGLRWDEPVPENMWGLVADYCKNDVIATEVTFNKRKSDWVARQILAEIADMTVNDKTNSLTERIIFNGNKHPKLVYTDLATGMSS